MPRRLRDLNPNTMPGPGDEETWPGAYGHPTDPRTDLYDEDDDEPEPDYAAMAEDMIEGMIEDRWLLP